MKDQPRFARATEADGMVHWINLAHVRRLSVQPAKGRQTALTAVHIDNMWAERTLLVVETPEQLLDQAR